MKNYNAMIEEIKTAIDERKKLRLTAEQEVASLKVKLADLEDKKTKALDEVDYVAFEAASIEETKAEFDLKSKERALEALSKPQNLSDYSGLWKDFSKAYEKEFSALYKEYSSARHDLYERFKVLMELQRQACNLRYSIGRACGFADRELQPLDINEYGGIGTFSGVPGDHVGPRFYRQIPDAAFFIATGEMPLTDEEKAYRIFVLKNIT